MSGFPYPPSFDGGLGRCTGAVSCGLRHLPFRVGERHARVPRVCACACSYGRGRAGRPPGRVLVRLTFPVAVLSFFFVRPPPGWGCLCFSCLFDFFSFFPLFVPPPFFPPPLSRPHCLRLFVLPGPGCPGPWCSSFAPTPLPPPPRCFSFPFYFFSPCLFLPLFSYLPSRAPAVSGFLCFPALGALGLGALRLLLPPPPPPPHPRCFFFVPSASFPPPLSRPLCLRLFVPPGPGCLGPWRSSFGPTPPPPHPPSFFVRPFFFPGPLRASLVAFLPLSPALGALGLGALSPPAPTALFLSFLFFFLLFCVPSFPWFRALLVLLACGVWVVFWGCAPPPERLLVFCCVWCLVVWCHSLLSAVLCGSWCFAVFFGALWCWCCAVWCVVVRCCWFWRCLSSVGAASAFHLLVSRGASLCHAVSCGVLSCVVPSRVVVWCVVLCVFLVHGVVWSSGLPCCVGFSSLSPPLPCSCPLLPLLGPLSWLVVVFCPGVRCCVGLLCRLSCGVLLSASFLAGAAPLLRSRWLLLCVVAGGCWVFAAGSGCPLLFSAGVPWRVCSCLVAWPCCAVLCCAVSCVLWRCVAVHCRAVVPCCPFCFVLSLVWSVWRCVAPWRRLWCVVLFFFVSCSVPPSCRPVPCSAAVWALFGA